MLGSKSTFFTRRIASIYCDTRTYELFRLSMTSTTVSGVRRPNTASSYPPLIPPTTDEKGVVGKVVFTRAVQILDRRYLTQPMEIGAETSVPTQKLSKVVGYFTSP